MSYNSICMRKVTEGNLLGKAHGSGILSPIRHCWGRF